jgi:hypothetical protein
MADTRGTSQFEVTPTGDLVNNSSNAEKLRRLWLDRTHINRNNLGPGNYGDFDNGAWHVACHLLGAGGVRRLADGRIAFLEISHRRPDEYFASITVAENGRTRTFSLHDRDGAALLQNSTLLGFVEGNSTGQISARGVVDPPDRFNRWKRQDFDNDINSDDDGGKVWEHWCTLRNIRQVEPFTTSLLQAYVALVAALGDRFVPTVARGRRDYAHPQQLVAMIEAGLTSKDSATLDVTPTPVPANLEPKLLQSSPADSLDAVSQLQWDNPPKYYMFQRRIARWSSRQAVLQDLGE